MTTVNPRDRQRQEIVVVRAKGSATLTNAELLADFGRALKGKVAPQSVPIYVSHCKDAIAFMRDEQDDEIHVSLWTKESIWDYIRFMEANYCKFYRVSNTPWAEPGVSCTKRQWLGIAKPLDVVSTCRGCDLFVASEGGLERRLTSLVKFFQLLSRLGIVQWNYMRDILRDWRSDSRRSTRREMRRNPSIEEMLTLVNKTKHPRNRAFYAASAKWWLRPNEMLMMDRYASFGLSMPEGVPMPAGFHAGFPAIAEARPLNEGGGLAYLPETKSHDKRRGNRWVAIDGELEPILLQYFAWWERHVKRDERGRPVTTALWLSETGYTLKQSDMYRPLFYEDCQRLALMTEADEKDPFRRWTAHCQRHFGEKVCMLYNVPDLWAKHFRGDIIKDARGHYFVPTPLQIRDAYFRNVPLLGFQPLADRTLRVEGSDKERRLKAFLANLEDGIRRVGAWSKHNEPTVPARLVELRGTERHPVAVVPMRYAHAIAAALGPHVLVENDPRRRVYMRKDDLVILLKRCLARLRNEPGAPPVIMPTHLVTGLINGGWGVREPPKQPPRRITAEGP